MSDGPRTPEVVVKPPVHDIRSRVVDYMEKGEGVYRKLGRLTRQKNPGTGQIPRHVRYERARAVERIKEIRNWMNNKASKDRREAALEGIAELERISVPEALDLGKGEEDAKWLINQILGREKARKEISTQFLSQGEVKRSDGVSARYTILEPPESRRPADYKNKPPIVFIPGVTNDLESVSSLAQEMALQGRKVYVFGFPEAAMGRVTEKFTEEVEKSTGYSPMSDFFKQSIRALCGEQDIELWGFSIGAPIVAEILNDPKFQKRTTNAVLLNPSSMVEMGKIKSGFGLAKESLGMLPDFLGKTLRWSFTMWRETPEEPESLALKKRVMRAMLEKATHVNEAWKTAKVKEGGTILAIGSEKDTLTYAQQIFNPQNEQAVQAINPQTKVEFFRGYNHSMPVREPEAVVRRIFGRLNKPVSKNTEAVRTGS